MTLDLQDIEARRQARLSRGASVWREAIWLRASAQYMTSGGNVKEIKTIHFAPNRARNSLGDAEEMIRFLFKALPAATFLALQEIIGPGQSLPTTLFQVGLDEASIADYLISLDPIPEGQSHDPDRGFYR